MIIETTDYPFVVESTDNRFWIVKKEIPQIPQCWMGGLAVRVKGGYRLSKKVRSCLIRKEGCRLVDAPVLP